VRDGRPEGLKAQAAEKAAKVGALLCEHATRRDAGRRKAETAYDRWESA
jgi:hypothetical protein